MTPWSPKQHQSQHKTTTISRRLRNRADQNLSVQPPEIPLLRTVRPRRASTLPTSHYEPSHHHATDPHPPSTAWETSEVLDHIPRSSTSNPRTVEEDAQPLDYPPYESPRTSRSEAATSNEIQRARTYHLQSTPGLTFLPSPLPSASGSHDFELRLSADPEPSSESYLDLQEMR